MTPRTAHPTRTSEDCTSPDYTSPVITICAQHLDGNDPEGLNVPAWLERLCDAYRATALAHYPDATVIVEIDRERHTSGATRTATAVLEIAGALSVDSELERDVELTGNYLWESVCDDPRLWIC
jgi:hypothetical protein